MTASLPADGSANWGDTLNAWLLVAHNADGTVNTSVLSALPYDPSGAASAAQTAAQTYAAAQASAAQSAAKAASMPRAGGAFTGSVTPTVVALAYSANIAVNAAAGNDFRVTLTGNATISAPSNAADGQTVTFEIIQDSTGSRTVTWASGAGGYAFGAASAPVLSTAASATDIVAFRYSSAKGKWLCLGAGLGF